MECSAASFLNDKTTLLGGLSEICQKKDIHEADVLGKKLRSRCALMLAISIPQEE
jgi:hypothetical protein